jgi:hypothetical protein
MIRLAKKVVTFAAAALLSSSAFAAINFSDNFEAYDLYVGPGYQGDIGGGWLIFANVFGDYPGCSQYWYGYGPFPAPNKDSGFSNITTGSSGQALNVFSDYDNPDHANGACLETSVFQETVFSSADVGTYTFRFDTQTPVALGTDVSTYGFIKLLDPNNNYNADIFLTVPTITAGTKTLDVILDASADGKILQWGFSTVASGYEPSGRVYDNASFALKNTGSYQGEEGVPIPLWALFAMAGVLALVGGSTLRSRRKA